MAALPAILHYGESTWIDQSDDYRIRSDNGRVKEAIQGVFGSLEPAREPGQEPLASSM